MMEGEFMLTRLVLKHNLKYELEYFDVKIASVMEDQLHVIRSSIYM